MGRTLLSKALVQLSADEWGCAPSLVVVWPEATQALGSVASMAGLVVASQRAYATRGLPRLLLPAPSPCGEPLWTHTPTGDPPTLASSCGSVCCEVIAPFLWVLEDTSKILCTPRLESPFPSVLWKSYNQILLASRSGSWESPSPSVRSLG